MKKIIFTSVLAVMLCTCNKEPALKKIKTYRYGELVKETKNIAGSTTPVECAGIQYWQCEEIDPVTQVGTNCIPDGPVEQIVCEGGETIPEGGGTGGGSPELSTCVKDFANLTKGMFSVSVKDGIEDCGTFSNNRCKRYRWKIFKVSGGLFPSYITSMEKGFHIYKLLSGKKQWSFSSFEHVGIYTNGLEVFYGLKLDDIDEQHYILEHPVTHVPDQIAKTSITYSVKISAVCNGVPISTTIPASSTNSWHVTEH